MVLDAKIIPLLDAESVNCSPEMRSITQIITALENDADTQGGKTRVDGVTLGTRRNRDPATGDVSWQFRESPDASTVAPENQAAQVADTDEVDMELVDLDVDEGRKVFEIGRAADSTSNESIVVSKTYDASIAFSQASKSIKLWNSLIEHLFR